MTTLRALCLIAAAAAWLACSSVSSSEHGAAPESRYSNAPEGSKLAKVEVGMTDDEVREILGDPDDEKAYMTRKAWSPFYYGPDTHRSDWMYLGQGRVVYSRNRHSGALKVIRVLYDPSELK